MEIKFSFLLRLFSVSFRCSHRVNLHFKIKYTTEAMYLMTVSILHSLQKTHFFLVKFRWLQIYYLINSSVQRLINLEEIDKKPRDENKFALIKSNLWIFHFPTDSGDGERVRGLLDALRDHVRGNAPRLCACRWLISRDRGVDVLKLLLLFLCI